MLPDYTMQDRLKIVAGAVAALVIVGWLLFLANAVLSTP